jgi:hypothetical protein
MENKIKIIILALAVSGAAVLFFIGFRKINLKQYQRKNFFFSSLLIALAFFGCNFTGGSSQNNENDPEFMNDFRGASDSLRIKELNKTLEWKEFKSFWKSMDALEPGNAPNNYYFSPYLSKGNSDYQKLYDLSDSLNKKIGKLEPKLQVLVHENLLDSLESGLLKRICDARVKIMCFGSVSMLTRMMPPPGLMEREQSINAFEYKIDTLLMLKKQNKIDKNELEIALSNVQMEIKKFTLLDLMGEAGFLKYSYDFGSENASADTMNIIDKSLLDFEKSYTEFMKKYNPAKADAEQKQLYDKYVATKKELDGFTKNYSAFCDLIKDLVVND